MTGQQNLEKDEESQAELTWTEYCSTSQSRGFFSSPNCQMFMFASSFYCFWQMIISCVVFWTEQFYFSALCLSDILKCIKHYSYVDVCCFSLEIHTVMFTIRLRYNKAFPFYSLLLEMNTKLRLWESCVCHSFWSGRSLNSFDIT